MIERSSSAVLMLLVILAIPAVSLRTQVAPKHIHIIGASVSAGFEDGPFAGAKVAGDSIPMHKVLKNWSGGVVKVTTHPMLEMCYTFSDPVKIGKKQIDRAKAKKADLVVAVDFPFWFAYGFVRGDEAKARLGRLDQCLTFLASLDVPVIIGDLPNMKGAALRMLKPRQIPSDELLAQLNERLAEFAAGNNKITIVPVAHIVKQLKVDGVKLPFQDGGLQTAPGALLQEDQLHVTRIGMALLTYQIQDALRANFPPGHALNEQKWTFDEFAEAVGADDELQMLREADKQRK